MLPPLNYTFYTQVINYQLYVFVVFNRQVSLTPQQFPLVAQIATSDGPIKASQYSINQTTPTTYCLKMLNSASLN
jgi:hypothetical protein